MSAEDSIYDTVIFKIHKETLQKHYKKDRVKSPGSSVESCIKKFQLVQEFIKFKAWLLICIL